MENYTTMKGQLDINFTQEQINDPEKLFKRIDATQSIYNNLNIALGNVVNDLNNLGRHMLQASNAFSALSNYTRDSEQSPLLVTCYGKLRDIFSQWSASYDKQKFFLDHNFREFFVYMNLQVKALSELQKQHKRIRTDYEQYGLELLTKKEKLFNSKKYNAWELSEEDNRNIETLKTNKESAFKAMLPGMTNLVSAQKIQVACSTNIIKQEYERFMKRQGNNLKEYLLSLKDKNQNIISDAYTLCSLFNIEL
jgi:phosphopantetheinyl transferase (holo-ACP synthase)